MNITFHFMTKKEIQYYFIDVLHDASIVEERIDRLTDNSEEKEQLREVYSSFHELKLLVDKGESSFSESYGYALAVISGFIHPYYCSQFSSISYLTDKKIKINKGVMKNIFTNNTVEISEMFHSVSSIFSLDLYDAFEMNSLISKQFTASGLISLENIKKINNVIHYKKNKKVIAEVFNLKDLDMLKEALKYAISHETYLFEASGIVSITNRKCFSKIYNLQSNIINKNFFNKEVRKGLNYEG